MNEPILQIEDLKIAATELPLVRGLSFSLKKGKTLGIVGESGSGKSLTSLAIMGLLSRGLHLTGKIRFEGKELTRLSPQQYLQIRGNEISMVFQEPMTALNPSMKCGKQVAEILETLGFSGAGIYTSGTVLN